MAAGIELSNEIGLSICRREEYVFFRPMGLLDFDGLNLFFLVTLRDLFTVS